jgi:hypothetical protein
MIISQKKLLTRNRFRDFLYSILTYLYSIFTKWNVNLLLIQIEFTVII